MNQSNLLLDALKRHWKLATFIGVVLLVFIIVSQYAFVTVTVTGGNNDTTLALYRDGTNAGELRQGFNIVSRGSYALRASTNDRLTERRVDLKPFTMNRTDVQLAAQRSIHKVASDSLGCVTAPGNLLKAKEVFTYNCARVTSIVGYSFISRPSSVLVYRKTLDAPKSYKGGLLGLGTGIADTDDELQLAYIQGKRVTPLNYTANPLLDVTRYEVLVPFNDQGRDTDAFVVADGNEGKLTLFEGLSDKQPTNLSIKESDHIYSFAAGHNSVYVLSVKPATTPRNSDNAGDGHDTLQGGILRRYSMQGGSLKEDARIEVPETFEMFGFKVIDSNTFVTRNLGGKIVVYRLEGSNLVVHDQIDQSDEMVTQKGGFVYKRDKDYLVYDANSQQSQLVYRIDRLTPTYLQNNDGQIIISARVPNIKEQYSFVLTDNERTNGLERILNYPRENISVRSIDYNNTTIFVEFALTSFVWDHTTGRLGSNASELADKEAPFKAQLQKDGFDPTKYKIITNNLILDP